MIPVYQGAQTIPELARRLHPVLSGLAPDHEIIFVDDGSKDGSWEVIENLAAGNRRIRGLRLMRNFGQHNAIFAGIQAVQYPITITMDEDLQHVPEEIPKLIEALERGADVVYGRPAAHQHSPFRNWASISTKLMLKSVLGAETAALVNSFRAFRTRLRDAFSHYSSPFVFVDVLLTWGTRRISAITVQHQERQDGRSGYNFIKLLRHTITMATSFSVVPLRFASIVGFGFTLLGVLVLAYVLVNFLMHGRTVAGFPFLASIVAIFSGVQLFSLGVIGEYLARMHIRLMDKPSYVIAETTAKATINPV